jgi:hypothetical protein
MREVSSLKIASSEVLNNAKSESESRLNELRSRLEAANGELRSELSDLQSRFTGYLLTDIMEYWRLKLSS